ncbi:WD40-repeat-containing domain protein [Suillus fuscotomentosus]|uniref:WD40-repeat-containing domain protein n=1 Tax=Suillus fuscotomentosus TaxID=1912939 RepID=A0AAD4DXM2_9AGAM|nr:WD40-repeat-containing domain protein [Suillus fuscotomentosus]KAG1895989.1 WD40-repeat-containing domain protein [Suillus fuscotomentosus]
MSLRPVMVIDLTAGEHKDETLFSQVSHYRSWTKYTLTCHTKAVNVLAVSMHGALLLTGGNDNRIVVWSLASGEMIQEIFAPASGFISAITWMDVDDQGETTFAFGASDGNIQVYERIDNGLFQFQSIMPGHAGAVESLAWDPVHRRLASAGDGHPHVWNFTSDRTLNTITSQLDKQPYIACTIHFYDNGASLLVSFLESGEIFCYSIEPWDLKWRKKVQGRIGNTALEGNFLLVSNLKDGVDKYTVPTLQRVQSYSHVIIRNAGLIFIGGDDGFARIFNYSTGAFRGQLEHGNPSDQIIPVTSHEGRAGCTVVTGSCFNGHSSVKVWEEGELARVEDNLAPSSPSVVSSPTMQLLRFAIICVVVNIAMHAFHSGVLSELSLIFHDIVVSAIGTS